MSAVDMNSKNLIAIRSLVGALIRNGPFDPEATRHQCRTFVYTCFLMEIEPYQLPIAAHIQGNLSESRKMDFWRRYVGLYMDGTEQRHEKISRVLDHVPKWAELLDAANRIIDKTEI
jgi:hypothetical protein